MTDAAATSLGKKLAIGFTLVASAGVHLVFTRMPDTMGDVGMYVSWANAVERLGIAGAYFSPQRFPIDYPPVSLVPPQSRVLPFPLTDADLPQNNPSLPL